MGLTETDGWFLIFESEAKAFDCLSVGELRLLEIAGIQICIARTKSGIKAVADACPHLGASLSRGKCNAWGEVVCPWHSYRFELNTGEETTRNGYQVKTYQIEINESGVYIRIPELKKD